MLFEDRVGVGGLRGLPTTIHLNYKHPLVPQKSPTVSQL